MTFRFATLLLSLTVLVAGCAFGPPAPTPAPTPPPPLATAQAVVDASRSAVPATPTLRPALPKQGLSREEPAPAETGLPLEEGYVIFAKIRDDDANARVRELSPSNPPPAAGKRYISVTVIMSSARPAASTLSVSSAEFGMLCSSGAQYKPLTSLGAKGPDGELSGGRQILGELIFEVGELERSHLLTYAPAAKPGKEFFLKLASS